MCKVIKLGYSNVMLSYYIDYKDKLGKHREYFDTIEERNEFIRENINEI